MTAREPLVVVQPGKMSPAYEYFISGPARSAKVVTPGRASVRWGPLMLLAIKGAIIPGQDAQGKGAPRVVSGQNRATAVPAAKAEWTSES
jgi:hypothetical protein